MCIASIANEKIQEIRNKKKDLVQDSIKTPSYYKKIQDEEIQAKNNLENYESRSVK